MMRYGPGRDYYLFGALDDKTFVLSLYYACITLGMTIILVVVVAFVFTKESLH